MSARFALGLLLISILGVAARRPVKVSPKCVNLLPGVLDQAYGFDPTDSIPAYNGPNIQQNNIENPFLTYSCDFGHVFRFISYYPTSEIDYQVPDQLDTIPLPSGSYRSSSKCFETSEQLEKHVFSEVSDWEKNPLGSFVNTNDEPSNEFNIPKDARCLASEMRSQYRLRAVVRDEYDFNDTHPLLDTSFQSHVTSLGSGQSYAELIRSFGTSYWDYGHYGTNIHVYVFTSTQIGTAVIDSALESFESSSEPRVENWIKSKVDVPSTVFVRYSGSGRWSSKSIALFGGEAKLFGKTYTPVENEALYEAVSEYLKKAGFKKDWRGNWKYATN